MATRMIRKQVYIPKRQQTKLKRLAQTRGVSEAEIIRQAIERQTSGALGSLTDRAAWGKALQFMLALRARGPLGNQPRRWKREDAYKDRLNRYGHHSG
jgi:hypothetical protein